GGPARGRTAGPPDPRTAARPNRRTANRRTGVPPNRRTGVPPNRRTGVPPNRGITARRLLPHPPNGHRQSVPKSRKPSIARPYGRYWRFLTMCQPGAEAMHTAQEDAGTGSTRGGRHAVVVGGSLAGLLAANVLAAHVDRVTVVERDRFPEEPEPRPGVP